MTTLNKRTPRGAYQKEALVVASLVGILYYGYQYLAVYKAPTQLVNKDFICGEGVGSKRLRSYVVYGSQDPKLLVEYVRKSNIQARLQAPSKAMQNEDDRNRIMQSNQLVNLADDARNEPYSAMYNPLVVHVLETDTSSRDVPLLVVRPVNKKHKGETWYIAASSINPVANVTGFADAAAKTHKVGMLDVIENKDVQKAFKAISR